MPDPISTPTESSDSVEAQPQVGTELVPVDSQDSPWRGAPVDPGADNFFVQGDIALRDFEAVYQNIPPRRQDDIVPTHFQLRQIAMDRVSRAIGMPRHMVQGSNPVPSSARSEEYDIRVTPEGQVFIPSFLLEAVFDQQPNSTGRRVLNLHRGHSLLTYIPDRVHAGPDDEALLALSTSTLAMRITRSAMDPITMRTFDQLLEAADENEARRQAQISAAEEPETARITQVRCPRVRRIGNDNDGFLIDTGNIHQIRISREVLETVGRSVYPPNLNNEIWSGWHDFSETRVGYRQEDRELHVQATIEGRRMHYIIEAAQMGTLLGYVDPNSPRLGQGVVGYGTNDNVLNRVVVSVPNGEIGPNGETGETTLYIGRESFERAVSHLGTPEEISADHWLWFNTGVVPGFEVSSGRNGGTVAEINEATMPGIGWSYILPLITGRREPGPVTQLNNSSGISLTTTNGLMTHVSVAVHDDAAGGSIIISITRETFVEAARVRGVMVRLPAPYLMCYVEERNSFEISRAIGSAPLVEINESTFPVGYWSYMDFAIRTGLTESAAIGNQEPAQWSTQEEAVWDFILEDDHETLQSVYLGRPQFQIPSHLDRGIATLRISADSLRQALRQYGTVVAAQAGDITISVRFNGNADEPDFTVEVTMGQNTWQGHLNEQTFPEDGWHLILTMLEDIGRELLDANDNEPTFGYGVVGGALGWVSVRRRRLTTVSIDADVLQRAVRSPGREIRRSQEDDDIAITFSRAYGIAAFTIRCLTGNPQYVTLSEDTFPAEVVGLLERLILEAEGRPIGDDPNESPAALDRTVAYVGAVENFPTPGHGILESFTVSYGGANYTVQMDSLRSAVQSIGRRVVLGDGRTEIVYSLHSNSVITLSYSLPTPSPEEDDDYEDDYEEFHISNDVFPQRVWEQIQQVIRDASSFESDLVISYAGSGFVDGVDGEELQYLLLHVSGHGEIHIGASQLRAAITSPGSSVELANSIFLLTYSATDRSFRLITEPESPIEYPIPRAVGPWRGHLQRLIETTASLIVGVDMASMEEPAVAPTAETVVYAATSFDSASVARQGVDAVDSVPELPSAPLPSARGSFSALGEGIPHSQSDQTAGALRQVVLDANAQYVHVPAHWMRQAIVASRAGSNIASTIGIQVSGQNITPELANIWISYLPSTQALRIRIADNQHVDIPWWRLTITSATWFLQYLTEHEFSLPLMPIVLEADMGNRQRAGRIIGDFSAQSRHVLPSNNPSGRYVSEQAENVQSDETESNTFALGGLIASTHVAETHVELIAASRTTGRHVSMPNEWIRMALGAVRSAIDNGRSAAEARVQVQGMNYEYATNLWISYLPGSGAFRVTIADRLPVDVPWWKLTADSVGWLMRYLIENRIMLPVMPNPIEANDSEVQRAARLIRDFRSGAAITPTGRYSPDPDRIPQQTMPRETLELKIVLSRDLPPLSVETTRPRRKLLQRAARE